MADKIIATFAILLFVVFVVFLAYYINEIDLWIVIGLVAVLAVYDFWESLRHPENGSTS